MIPDKTTKIAIDESFESLDWKIRYWVNTLIAVNLPVPAVLFLLSLFIPVLNDELDLFLTVAVTGVFTFLPNHLISLKTKGYSRMMALTHIIFWIPLLVFLSLRVWGSPHGMFTSIGIFFGGIVFICNLISLPFDFVDTYRVLFRGESGRLGGPWTEADESRATELVNKGE